MPFGILPTNQTVYPNGYTSGKDGMSGAGAAGSALNMLGQSGVMGQGAGQVLSGAGSGASIGSFGGPVGTGVGAGLGALLGLFGGSGQQRPRPPVPVQPITLENMYNF